MGAIEGEVFHRGAVQALASGESQVTPRLAALVRKQLIRPERPQLPGEDAFRFRHLLIRDAAYEALPKAVRGDLHERLAAWLEDTAANWSSSTSCWATTSSRPTGTESNSTRSTAGARDRSSSARPARICRKPSS